MTIKTGSLKRLSFSLFAVLAFSVLRGELLHAQQPEPPANAQPAPAKSPGFGQQLANETREAAGEDKEDKSEKDDKAVFKQSASVRYIARTLGVSTEKAALLSFLFNFAVIAGILIWALRKRLPSAFRARSASIQQAMQEAQKASEEARRRLADIESRLAKIDIEIGQMRDKAERDAAAEEARIKTATEEESCKIVESAQQEIASAAKAARRALSAYAADLAVGLAQKQIRVDSVTDQALVRNFARDLTSGLSGSDPGKDRN